MVAFCKTRCNGVGRVCGSKGVSGSLPYEVGIISGFRNVRHGVVVVSAIEDGGRGRCKFTRSVEHVGINFSHTEELLVIVKGESFFERGTRCGGSVSRVSRFSVGRLRRLME